MTRRKKLVVAVVAAVLGAAVYAGTMVKDMTNLAQPDVNDVLYVVHDPNGTPLNRKLTIGTLREVFNAKDYGATGDGTTDDTAAIQAAITAATAAKSVAYFPPGTYLLNSSLTVADYAHLIGVPFQSILKIGTQDDAAIDVTAVGSRIDYVIIDGLTFDTEQTGCQGILGPADEYIAHWTIRNCSFEAELICDVNAVLGHVTFADSWFGFFGTAGSVCQAVGCHSPVTKGAFDNSFYNCYFSKQIGCLGAVEFGYGNTLNFYGCTFEAMDTRFVFARGMMNILLSGCCSEDIDPADANDAIIDVRQDAGGNGYWPRVALHSCRIGQGVGDAPVVVYHDSTAWTTIQDSMVILPSGGGHYTYDGTTYDTLLTLRGNVTFSDAAGCPPEKGFDYASPSTGTIAKTADDGLALTDSGKRFSNSGASGSVTLALPADAENLEFEFIKLVNQAFLIDPNDGTDHFQGMAAGAALSLDNIGDVVRIGRYASNTWYILRGNVWTTTLGANAGLAVKNSSISAGYVDLYEDSDNGAQYIGFICPAAVTASKQYILPDDTEWAETGFWLNTAGTLSVETYTSTKSLLSVDDLVTLSGVADGAAHLGTFTGTTIADSSTNKVALQALETAVEGKQAADADLTDLADGERAGDFSVTGDVLNGTGVVLAVKTFIATVQLDDDTVTADYAFDDDAANTTEQVITLTNVLPAYAELLSWQIRCFEGTTAATTAAIDFGTSSGGTEIGEGDTSVDDTGELIGAAAGAGPVLLATSAARSLYFGVVPSSNWADMASVGRWSIMVTYIDYAAVHTQKNP